MKKNRAAKAVLFFSCVCVCIICVRKSRAANAEITFGCCYARENKAVILLNVFWLLIVIVACVAAPGRFLREFGAGIRFGNSGCRRRPKACCWSVGLLIGLV